MQIICQRIPGRHCCDSESLTVRAGLPVSSWCSIICPFACKYLFTFCYH